MSPLAVGPHPPVRACATRADWQARADAMLRAVEPWWTPSRARLALPGPTSGSGPASDGLEGFARTFLLAALRVRGSAGADPAGLLERYAHGLAAGVDPTHAERWPRMSERRQARVEAASIAIALSETRPWLWDVLPERVREQCVSWFAEIVGTSDYRNNWLWFQDVVETFLAQVGGPWSAEDRERNEALRESLYVGDGWYSDGRGRDGEAQSFDYYAGWAWHVYPLLVARMRGEALSARHAERLGRFVADYTWLFGAEGAPVALGRSVTYRYAVLAPIWAARLARVGPLSAGQTRDLTSRVLTHLDDAVAPDGVDVPLSIGWRQAFPPVRQLYTGAASPYWASKGFLGLLLPPDDAVWVAEPDRSWALPGTRSLPVPGWIADRTDDGVVRLVNHGSDRQLTSRLAPRADDPWYLRTAYSNEAGPSVIGRGVGDPLEQHVAVLDADGRGSHRDAVERVALGPGAAASASWTHWLDVGDTRADAGGWATLRRGPRVLVASFVHDGSEVRLAVVLADAREDQHDVGGWPCHAPRGPWRLRFGGWALAGTRPPEDLDDAADADGDGAAAVRIDRGGSRLTSLVRALGGAASTRGMESGVVRRSDDNPFGPHSATPWVVLEVRTGETAWCELVLTAGARVPEVATWGLDTSGRARVTWRDGYAVTLDVPLERPAGAPEPQVPGGPASTSAS